MVVELPQKTDSSGKCTCSSAQRTGQAAVSMEDLRDASIVHFSDALRRKFHSIAPEARVGATVGEVLQFAAHSRKLRSATSGLWSMLGWLVRGPEADQATEMAVQDMDDDSLPQRPRNIAQVPEDDPLLIGNEGLGHVELAAVRRTKHSCIFALCAHALPGVLEDEWQAWAKATRRRSHQTSRGEGAQLAIVHVAEVSTLHQAACCGIPSLLPPPVPLEQYFSRFVESSRSLGPPPSLPPLLRRDAEPCTIDSPLSWMSMLVSRHGLVEMAYPLRHATLSSTDGESGADLDPTLEGTPPVALASLLGESVFSRIHPEDVARVVKALRLAWDARPDVYHFSRLRREWQRRRLSSAGERAVSSAPNTPPMRPHRSATMHTGGARPVLGDRQVHHREGIEVANGMVELNVQVQISGTSSDIDWDDLDSTAEHARFAKMRLTRWPLILKPPKPSAYRDGESEEPQDGFVLIGLQPLPEPSRSRTATAVEPHGTCHDQKKHSISSIASTSTLVGLGVAPQQTGSLDALSLDRLCRSTSSLSCQELTARSSIDSHDELPATDMQRTPTPVARPIVGLTANVVQTATAMSPHQQHLAMRRRSNIVVGSLQSVANMQSFGTPREFAD
ncbi:hypothetical protein EC988_000950 [Linderina pennispora]|nr:hypothetical protein EC988_000950 [Linderina pennispora]